MLSDDELEIGCLMTVRFFVTDLASRANLLSAAVKQIASISLPSVLACPIYTVSQKWGTHIVPHSSHKSRAL